MGVIETRRIWMQDKIFTILESYQEVLPLINKWVNTGLVSPQEKKELIDHIKISKTRSRHLERIDTDDPDLDEGDVINLGLTSFTSVRVSEGQSAGQIS